MASASRFGIRRSVQGLLVRAALALLALATFGGAVQSAPKKPRAVAFIVGIENFDRAELNTLNYVAADAVQVYHAIDAITDLDRKNSQVLLATAKIPEAIQGLRDIPSGVLTKKDKLARNEIQDGLEEFLNKARTLPSDTLLYIYFGGHGAAESSDQGMSFLPSNFQKEGAAFKANMTLESMVQTINSKLGSHDRPTIILMNACHASGESSVKRDTLKEQFANKQRFFFPASVSTEKTFEIDDLKGSFFVRALTDAMYGGAADREGAVTTSGLTAELTRNLEQLYQQYAKGIRLTLPQPETGMGAPIMLGVVSEVQSQEKGMLGIALGTAASNIERFASDESSSDSPTVSRRHPRMLYRLAAMNFHRAAQLTEKPEPKAEWYFAEASSQTRAFLAPHILPLEMGAILPDDIADKVREPIGVALRYAAANLKAPSTAYEPLGVSAKAALTVFDREVRYATVLLQPQAPATRTDQRSKPPSPAAEQHKDLLQIFAENTRSKVGDRPVFEFVIGEDVKEVSPELKAFLAALIDKDGGKKMILNIVYSGRSTLETTDGPAQAAALQQTNQPGRGKAGDLAPVSSRLLWSIAEAWPERPVNILFDSDYGGVIRQRFPDALKARVSLLLTAEQEKGRRDEAATYPALKRALKNGLTFAKLEDITRAQGAAIARTSGRSADGEQPGRAALFGALRQPFANEFLDLRTALNLGRQLDWWAYYWGARGTRLPIIDSATVVSPAIALSLAQSRVFSGDKWQSAADAIEDAAKNQTFRGTGVLSFWCTMAAFRLGLLRELATDRASPFEKSFAHLCGAPGVLAREHFTAKDDGPIQWRRAVSDVKQVASKEFGGLGSFLQALAQVKQAMADQKPKVHLVALTAGDYKSPYIPRLEGVDQDMAAWRELLKKRLGDRLEVHELPSPGANQTIADTVRATLTKVAAESKDLDLILFLYSGRGYTLSDGSAALVPVDATARISWLSRSPLASLFSSDGNSKSGGLVHMVCDVDRPSLLRPTPLSATTARECLKVEEIAQIARTAKRGLVAIFDTQFGAVPGQLASLLDRYVFPGNQSNAEDDGRFGPVSGMLYPKAADYPQSLMIWLEGRVPNIPIRIGTKANISTAMLMDAFATSEPSTYRDLYYELVDYPSNRTSSMFSLNVGLNEMFDWWELSRGVREHMRPAMVGEVKRPLFAGGSDIDTLVALAAQEDRHRLNLRIGADLARVHAATAKDDPLVALTTVAALAIYADALREYDRERARRLYAEASAILAGIKEDQLYASSEVDNLYIDYLYWTAYVNGDEEVVDDALRQLTGVNKDRMTIDIAALYGQFITELTKKAAGRSADKIDRGRRLLSDLRAHYARFGTGSSQQVLSMLTSNIRALEAEANNYKATQKAEDRYGSILKPGREQTTTGGTR